MFIDIVSTNVKVLHHLGEESHNLNKLNKPFPNGVNQRKSCNNSCKSVNYIETSLVPYKGNILIGVDIMYGQFDQNEQSFRTNYVQVFLYWSIYYTYSKYVQANFKVSV